LTIKFLIVVCVGLLYVAVINPSCKPLDMMADTLITGTHQHPDPSGSLRGFSSPVPTSPTTATVIESSTPGDIFYNPATTAVASHPNLGIPKIEIPSGCTKFYIDVGAFKITEFSGELTTNPALFVVAFEPTPTTYKIHQNNFLHPHLNLLNAAASPQLGSMPFYANEQGAHCNSLLERNDGFESPTYENGAKKVVQCTKHGERVDVPTLPLWSIIEQLPKLDLLKIDAQGYDFEVVKTAAPVFHMITEVTLECQDIGEHLELALYKNMAQCPEIISYMESHGWKETKRGFANEGIKEYDLWFEKQ
jgi:FkbM family methyltransferase